MALGGAQVAYTGHPINFDLGIRLFATSKHYRRGGAAILGG